jgi:glycogen operon protein
MSERDPKATGIKGPTISTGAPLPLGATFDQVGDSVNFSVFSQHARAVWLLLFNAADDKAPFLEVALNRTQYYWHASVQGIAEGTFYAFRADGPSGGLELSTYGHRFNRQKVLIDPYARGNYDGLWVEADAISDGDNVTASIRSCVIEERAYDWEGDHRPRTPLEDTIIYELHVRGYTRSPSSNCLFPGVFAGLIEKIPYLVELGVTAIELLPIFDFDGKTQKRTDPTTGAPLYNYWGYDPYGFFAPNSDYCSSPQSGAHMREFRDLIKAFHRNNIEVILDVVFNHSGEGDQHGPTINFKGLDNSVYYDLSTDKTYYTNFTGAGNTLNAEHPVFGNLVRDSLRFWVGDMHVDGFRFDLGSLFDIRGSGEPMAFPPIVWAIDLEPSLAGAKLIVEPLGDAIGRFPEANWSTWNWKLKDAVRRFVRGDRGLVGEVATRIAGSSDVFSQPGQSPVCSISYVASHDGMTLQDLVSYNEKHNERNGEDSGDNNDMSWNCGVEGPTPDPAVQQLRRRQAKNFLAILFLSQGVPMLLAGDECGRTQQGNNNAWDQDNTLSWFDWSPEAVDADRLGFTKALIAFRKRHRCLRRTSFFTGAPGPRGLPDIQWHGCLLGAPGWNDPNSGVLAFTLAGDGDEPDLHVMLNSEDQPLGFELPAIPGRRWFRAIDTSLSAPNDISAPGSEQLVSGSSYIVNGRSVCALIATGP